MKSKEEVVSNDGVRLLVDRASEWSQDHGDPRIPSIHITSTPDSDSAIRGRSVTRVDDIELTSLGARSSSVEGEEHLLSNSGLRPRRSSPSPSRGNSLLQRLGTLRSSGRASTGKMSSRRGRGGQYNVLDEDEADEQFGIDLSTLAGMGYRLNDPPGAQSQNMGMDPRPESSMRNDLLQAEPNPMSPTTESRLGLQQVISHRRLWTWIH